MPLLSPEQIRKIRATVVANFKCNCPGGIPDINPVYIIFEYALGCKTAMDAKTRQPARNLSAGYEDQFSPALHILDEAIAARVFPGCAFGVLALGDPDKEIQLQGARGRFTYDQDSPAVTPETVYDIASLTKVVATTATVMLLVQRGLLDLKTPLGDLLPEFLVGRSSADPARQVKLHHLLAHNSGLPGYVKFFETTRTPQDLLKACLGLSLEADPGTRAEYSDPGFILLGKALEALTHESLATWTERKIFRPLGMTATGFCPPPAARPLIPPTEEDRAFRQRRIQGEVQDENASLLGGIAGQAGLFSNIPDLLRFARQVLPEVSDTGSPRLFAEATIASFAKRQIPEGSSRALGWDTPSGNSSSGHHFSSRSIGHLGYSGCSLWIDLEASVAVTLLTNRTWPDRQNQAIRQLRPAFHDAIREVLPCM